MMGFETYRTDTGAGRASGLGTLSLTLLLTTLCTMAFGLLIASMAISTLTLSETRAETVRTTYQMESVAQSIVASLDETCASGMPPEDALDIVTKAIRTDSDLAGKMDVTGSYENGLIRIRLECGRRYLSVVLEPSSQGLETREWVMGSMPNEEPTLGPLL